MRRWLWVWALLGCDDGGGAQGRDQNPQPDQGVVDMALGDGRVPDATPLDAAPVDASPDVGTVPGPLEAAAGPDLYAEVGVPLQLDGRASTGAVAYQWDFGDGQRWEAPRPEATAAVTYARVGRYQATLTAVGPDGRRDADGVTVSVTLPGPFVPRPPSSSIALLPSGGVAVVVPDAHQVVTVVPQGEGFAVGARWPTCASPRTVAVWGEGLAVACPAEDAVWVVGGGAPVEYHFPYGSRPFGVVVDGEDLAVTLQGTGEVAWLRPGGEVAERWPAVPDARGLTRLGPGRVVVTRWRSPDGEGRLVVVERATGARQVWPLAFDPQAPSDTEIGGVPGYLGQVLLAPTGHELAVPSLQANVRHGPLFDGEVPAFDTVLRSVVSFLQPLDGTEDFDARKQFDGRGFASAATYSARGDYLFVAMRGSQVIERADRLSGTAAGTLVDAGYAVEGLVLSADDRWLFADASLSREVRIWDVSSLRAVPLPGFKVATVEAEPLDPIVFRGKQLFNDGADPRLARDGYIACAHCHLDGDSDRLTWDFTARGEGLRNTISLLGRGGTGHGPVHWSANFDEIQDFEHDIRGPFGGTGLMSDADFATANTSLGPPKAGLSADLDALAAYVATLTMVPRSPLRGTDGAPTAAAVRGEAIFQRLACDACHRPPTYTDSGFLASGEPLLHDVGTLRPSSGQRLGGPLVGIDTPTLLGLFDSAPYLHDGSAPTLRAVLTERNVEGQHGETAGLSGEELDDLEAFLLSLDGR